jgi:hypothetical protein
MPAEVPAAALWARSPSDLDVGAPMWLLGTVFRALAVARGRGDGTARSAPAASALRAASSTATARVIPPARRPRRGLTHNRWSARRLRSSSGSAPMRSWARAASWKWAAASSRRPVAAASSPR